VHRATAVLVGVCLATAAVLYLEPLATLVGRRALVVQLHVLAGLALPLPVLLGRLSAAYRADLRALNRFTRADGDWLRRRDRRSAGLPVGKFNAGQKLNAALSAGGGLVLLGTGVVMAYGSGWPLSLRTGSTFVHDWTAAALFLLVLGHLRLAYRDEDARRGMRTGRVPVGWARREHPAWAAGFRAGRPGQVSGMEPQDEERVHSRAELTPEELAAGSEDPQAQAEAVLADSDERTEVRGAAPDTVLERRSSQDAADLA
jgi:formate dehydrogenase subunit gamma